MQPKFVVRLARRDFMHVGVAPLRVTEGRNSNLRRACKDRLVSPRSCGLTVTVGFQL